MAKLVDPLFLFFSLIGGIVPVVIWLCFWLREDNKHPEPPRLIVTTFLAGILSIIPTYYAEFYASNLFTNPTIIFMAWALIEEVMKLCAAYLGGLRTKFYDEPVDALIYMITAALGFAAAENFLFIVNSVDSVSALQTGGMRFIGATLLHTLASATIGGLLALTFNRNRFVKFIALILGILTATMLHTSFNVSIINSNGRNISIVFLSLWLAIIFVILFFEKLRTEDKYD